MRLPLGLPVVLAAIVGVTAPPAVADSAPCGLSGAFRVYSNAFVYDKGGAGMPPSSYQQIALSGNTWQFGKSKGTFTTAAITAADWKAWNAKPYGPTQKMVLSGWNGGTATGPIESEARAVDFFWVIYHVTNPAPGTVEIKFGHAIVPKSC